MTRGYIVPIDPADLASRNAGPDALLEAMQEGGVNEELEAEVGAFLASANYEAQIEPLLERIPPREADLIHLYYLERKKQAEIAVIFDITQAAVSYRLDRGLQRLKFLLSIPQVDPDEMREDLTPVFPPIDVDILMGIWETTCQSEVAKKLNLTQGRVRHRFFKALSTLKGLAAAELEEAVAQAEQEADENDEDPVAPPEGRFGAYTRLFAAISENFNILREVKLPQWADRGMDCCI